MAQHLRDGQREPFGLLGDLGILNSSCQVDSWRDDYEFTLWKQNSVHDRLLV